MARSVAVSASRSEQSRFNAPAAIDVVQVDPFHATSPLVNLSELPSALPALASSFVIRAKTKWVSFCFWCLLFVC